MIQGRISSADNHIIAIKLLMVQADVYGDLVTKKLSAQYFSLLLYFQPDPFRITVYSEYLTSAFR